MSATILNLLVEKWEAQLDNLQRIDKTTTTLPPEAMDMNDDADICTLEALPSATLSECVRGGTRLLLQCDAS
jgi:hypothetical protein